MGHFEPLLSDAPPESTGSKRESYSHGLPSIVPKHRPQEACPEVESNHGFYRCGSPIRRTKTTTSDLLLASPVPSVPSGNSIHAASLHFFPHRLKLRIVIDDFYQIRVTHIIFVLFRILFLH